jgi:hypothetical protein
VVLPAEPFLEVALSESVGALVVLARAFLERAQQRV